MPDVLVLANALAVVGDEDVVLGFGGLGFKSYAIKEGRELKIAIEEVIKEKVAVCLVQDNFYQAGKEEINYYRSFAMPIFVPFAKDLKTDLLDSLLKNIRIKATGAFT